MTDPRQLKLFSDAIFRPVENAFPPVAYLGLTVNIFATPAAVAERNMVTPKKRRSDKASRPGGAVDRQDLFLV